MGTAPSFLPLFKAVRSRSSLAMKVLIQIFLHFIIILTFHIRADTEKIIAGVLILFV